MYIYIFYILLGSLVIQSTEQCWCAFIFTERECNYTIMKFVIASEKFQVSLPTVPSQWFVPLQINTWQSSFAGEKAFTALLISKRGYEGGKFIITHTHVLCVWHPKPKAQPSLGLRVAPGDLVSHFPLTLVSFFFSPFPQDSKSRGCAPATQWKTELTTVSLSSRAVVNE